VAVARLYDGVSPDGTSYKPDDVQKIHQAYGRDYQLAKFTRRIMKLVPTLVMYSGTGVCYKLPAMPNMPTLSNLHYTIAFFPGINLKGDKFLYTNPLAYSDAVPV
jgi:hypothetical protein